MTISQLTDIAKKRLTRHKHSMPGERRLGVMTRDTRRKLAAVAKQLSETTGFRVFPMQVAAMLVEHTVGEVEG